MYVNVQMFYLNVLYVQMLCFAFKVTNVVLNLPMFYRPFLP